MSVKTTIRRLSLAVSAATALSITSVVQAADTIKVGVLHSLSGTMAISETTLKDTMLMLIEDQNAKGGVLGKMLEPVVVDPASDWPLFAEKARELITGDGVDVVAGLRLDGVDDDQGRRQVLELGGDRVAGGFGQQQQLGLMQDGAGQGQALEHAAGERRHAALRVKLGAPFPPRRSSPRIPP